MSAIKKGKQRKIHYTGQPPPRWPVFLQTATKRIGATKRGFLKTPEALEQIAAEIVRGGEGESFLKAVRRGRPTARQNLRYQLLREVEKLIGAGVPRRREDNNTPESRRQLTTLKLEPV